MRRGRAGAGCDTGTGSGRSGSFAVFNNTVDGPAGIALTARAGGTDAEISGNTVSAGGVNVLGDGATRVRVASNAAPDGPIEISGDGLCADLSDNTAALLLSSTTGFGIAGLVPDPADAPTTAAFVAGRNAASVGTTATGAQFTSCTLPF